jgi:hypothetical protein
MKNKILARLVLCITIVAIFAAVVAPVPLAARTGRHESCTQLLYVTNNPIGGGGPDSLEYFCANANGNVSPLASPIAGSNTQMDGTGFVVVDSGGAMWVTQESGLSVTGYASGASGDAAPTDSISGSNTGLTSPLGLAIDSANGLYVGNCGSICGGSADNVEVFPARLNGNVSPEATIAGSNTQLSGVDGVAVDKHGNIWVANRGSDSVTEYAAGSNGNVSPTCTISGLSADPNGVAVDRNGYVYVRDGDYAIAVFSPGSCGNVQPKRLITGSNTGLDYPDGLFVTESGVLIVANRGSNSITEYAANANGNQKPMRTIAGSNTQLDGPVGVFVH